MRITHVITRLVVGGAQENTITSVLGLRQKPGFELKLVSGPTVGPEGSMESVVSSVPGLLTIVPELVRPIHPWKDWIALRRLTEIFLNARPDIVHTHSGKAGILGRMAARRAKVPVVVHHIHGPSFGPFQGWFANAVFSAAERYAGPMADHFFCSANAMTESYLAAGIGTPDMYTRVLSGFDVKAFTGAANSPELRAKLDIAPDDFVIGKIGRIAPLKGHSDLLRATQALLPQWPRTKLLIVGNGSLRAQTEAEARELGIADHVRFVGLVSPDAVPQYIGVMDCLAHLSYREALSRALPQALAAGKPVLAYDFAGAGEVCVDGQTGYLIPTGDISGVTEKLLAFARNPGLRKEFGERGRAMVSEQFTVENMIEEQAQVYVRLAKAKGIAQ